MFRRYGNLEADTFPYIASVNIHIHGHPRRILGWAYLANASSSGVVCQ